MSEPLHVALSLARHGFHVFPVSRRKVPLVAEWQKLATTDPEQIATWWGEHPRALVGYACGLSGVVVVDVDRKNGIDGLANLTAAGYELPPTLHYRTPSGGEHHVYRAPEGRDLTIAQAHPVEGVDIRAGNGFAIYYGGVL